MRFFENNEANHIQAFVGRLTTDGTELLRESNLRTMPGLAWNNAIPMAAQPCFTPFDSLDDFAIDVRSMIARPIICTWLSNVHGLRVGLEAALTLLFFSTGSLDKAVVHLKETLASACACIAYALLASIYDITETLHVALRLAVTAGSFAISASAFVMDKVQAAATFVSDIADPYLQALNFNTHGERINEIFQWA